MEAILMDVKRAMRSLLGMAHAVAGAQKRNGVRAGMRLKAGYKSFGENSFAQRDAYGRVGKVDIYSGREYVELHEKMAFGKNPLI